MFTINMINNILQEDDFTYSDISDYIEDLKKGGLKNEKKLKAMFKKAKEIASKQGKENDRKTVIGIMQGFMKG